ncbi:hypothetical protein J4E93_005717 [Alternaria ventricosa]|uniref:uncharacterized protein n=1 Tax=Alternaria ventricosa TaxID=1187951 RepID=UPI0020C58D29|nr:uncharacterized protein J4E93_005717 [Alternaria ventricosa]KAI4644919.1 hypothetical protein J4E93_005717 [Alternaria ventricosa]
MLSLINMRTRRSPPEPFRFLDLPAELRNSVFEFLTAEYEGCVRRFALKTTSSSLGASSTPASIFSLAHVCQNLRKEFLSHLFATLEVGLDWLDVEYFCHTVCSTFNNGEWLSTRAPKSITVYIDGNICNDSPISKSSSRNTLWNNSEIAAYRADVLEGIVHVPRMPHPSLNLLPLLKLRLLRNDYACLFSLDPKVDWDAVKEKHNSGDTWSDWLVGITVLDLAQFMGLDNDAWAQCIGKKLDQVLLHPWADWKDLQIELVFKEQPNNLMTLNNKTRRCYLPDLRKTGLREFYVTTGLTFNMSMASQSPKLDWEGRSRSRSASKEPLRYHRPPTFHSLLSPPPTHPQTQK